MADLETEMFSTRVKVFNTKSLKKCAEEGFPEATELVCSDSLLAMADFSNVEEWSKVMMIRVFITSADVYDTCRGLCELIRVNPRMTALGLYSFHTAEWMTSSDSSEESQNDRVKELKTILSNLSLKFLDLEGHIPEILRWPFVSLTFRDLECLALDYQDWLKMKTQKFECLEMLHVREVEDGSQCQLGVFTSLKYLHLEFHNALSGDSLEDLPNSLEKLIITCSSTQPQAIYHVVRVWIRLFSSLSTPCPSLNDCGFYSGDQYRSIGTLPVMITWNSTRHSARTHP